jgi:thiosulfate/3-mercaptopyruvate sulfurtransferase
MASDTLSPLVSTDWLEKNINDPKLVIIDIREHDEYAAGHIPKAIHVPSTSFIVTRGEFLHELPEVDDLLNTIGSAGIKNDSKVVVVNKADNPFALADTAKVACMLLYAGLANVAILNGGYDNWVREGKSVSDGDVKPEATGYRAKINDAVFASKEYVQQKLGKSIIIDGRDPDAFFGVIQEPWAKKLGHIPGATCLPVPWLYTEEGTYKNIEELREMAASIAGNDTSREIITYCGVGGYASALYYLLARILGYKNVRIYNGATQEWTRDPKAPVVKYRWD